MIDTNKLAMKHYLRIHTALDGYPTQADMLFELVSYLEDNGAVDVEFTASSVRHCFGLQPTEEKLSAFLHSTLHDGYLSQRIDATGITYYQMTSHPWQ